MYWVLFFTDGGFFNVGLSGRPLWDFFGWKGNSFFRIHIKYYFLV